LKSLSKNFPTPAIQNVIYLNSRRIVVWNDPT
jgi:hypothetical protein